MYYKVRKKHGITRTNTVRLDHWYVENILNLHTRLQTIMASLHPPPLFASTHQQTCQSSHIHTILISVRE